MIREIFRKTSDEGKYLKRRLIFFELIFNFISIFRSTSFSFLYFSLTKLKDFAREKLKQSQRFTTKVPDEVETIQFQSSYIQIFSRRNFLSSTFVNWNNDYQFNWKVSGLRFPSRHLRLNKTNKIIWLTINTKSEKMLWKFEGKQINSMSLVLNQFKPNSLRITHDIAND